MLSGQKASLTVIYYHSANTAPTQPAQFTTNLIEYHFRADDVQSQSIIGTGVVLLSIKKQAAWSHLAMPSVQI